MARFEYQVVPAPTKGTKAKGVKTPEARFSLSLQDLMNEMGAEGWEYQRAETLPSVERTGLTGSTTNWRHVLVFRRALPEDPADAPEIAEDSAPPLAAAAVAAAPIAATAAPQLEPDADLVPEDHPAAQPAGQPGATVMLKDDGVEEISDVSGVTASLNTLAAARNSKSDV